MLRSVQSGAKQRKQAETSDSLRVTQFEGWENAFERMSPFGMHVRSDIRPPKPLYWIMDSEHLTQHPCGITWTVKDLAHAHVDRLYWKMLHVCTWVQFPLAKKFC